MKFLVLNGPNLKMLGIREPAIYGSESYADLVRFIRKVGKENGIQTVIRQSNYEGDLIGDILKSYKRYDAIVINPGAYTHTSIALADALLAVNLPSAEVHLSNIDERENFRKISYIGNVVNFRFYGNGFESYRDAISALCELIAKK